MFDRTLGFACVFTTLVAASALSLRAEEVKPADLPLEKVVLFTSGVGFFEHRGKVNDDASVELKFNVEDINDLLKSMVLEDRGGGRISTITYGSRDPVTKTLKTFAIDLTREPTLADLLRQVRGERVSVDAPNPVEGKIIGVEQRQQKFGKDEVQEINILNLLTATGVQSIRLDSIREIRLLDEKLNAELNEALGVLASSHVTDKKTVTLRFAGKGERDVRVGYIQQSPIWKTSYRLVLNDDKAPFLQGWAIVENTTEQDWNDVRLTLISGRPISFIMDLYQPLYVGRPLVEPELYASLRPQKYGQDLAGADEQFRQRGGGSFGRRRPTSGAMGGMGGGGMASPPRIMSDEQINSSPDDPFEEAGGGPIDINRGVASAAKAEEVGELFRYEIDEPVKLARQQSAMLPIVNGAIEGEKVSIYNPAVQAKHPLNGVQLKNTTDLHLMQGPITLFDDGVYAGDAQIEDLAPGAKRLLSYALDLDTEVAVERKAEHEDLVAVKIVKGVLIHQHRHERELKYTVKNSGNKQKKVLIEQPFDPAWTLKTPKEATEKTRALYRFAIEAKPGKPAVLAVHEEKLIDQQFAILGTDLPTIEFYVKSKVTSPEIKQALEQALKLRRVVDAISLRQEENEQQLRAISSEQDRIRQNMAQLDRTSDLYKRYVKKFGEQEDQVELLRAATEKLVAERTKADGALVDFVSALELN
jgi:hypothetical protein